ncbi:MAG: SDR family NAD(P)-dependent oxidoreductase [Ahrensia sp.]|nr:SDR family NAD(P)-dependent oxidoreductase [Ahrensia sp.]
MSPAIETPDLSGRLALITGASRGIGYQIALQMAKAGAEIIAVARTVGGLEELDDAIVAAGGKCTLVPLDLKDHEGVDRLGGVIAQRWGKLDILVANAGMLGTIAPTGQTKSKIFDEVVDINFKSVWRLIRTTEPLLRQSDAGRALLLSSSVAHSARAFWGPYAATKAAVEILGRTWAAETANSALRVNNVNPGATATRMRAQAMPGENAASLPTAEEVAAKIIPLASPKLMQTGMLFDVPSNQWLNYNPPS